MRISEESELFDSMTLKASGSADSHIEKYRPDIDGLRAVAVLAVVFYHLSKAVLPGGYLGVDVFFVISGYLITSIIWKEIKSDSFSIVNFYDRRIRRILPALLLALIVTSVVALFLLLPTDLVGYSKSLLSTLLFVANIYFWRDSNYFSRQAEEKPLLHMWSLGVEEQFYIFFPLILMVCARYFSRHVLAIVVILTIGSFLANIVLVYKGGAGPAFYLLPTRAWEIGAGAIVAMIPAHVRLGQRWVSVAALVGLVLVISALFYPVQMVSYVPVGVTAVVGAALLIFAGRSGGSMPHRLLSSRPMVFIGLISFSLYLWHWPVIVFGQYYLVRELSIPEMVLAFGVMLACAVLSWRYIERPFRSKSISIKMVRCIAGGGAIVLAALALTIILREGFPGRLSPEAARINEAVGTHYRCPVSDLFSFGASRACQLTVPSSRPADADVVLLGNSHAQMYAPAWRTILQERGLSGLLVPVNGCLPTTTANISLDCMAMAERNLQEILKLENAKTVILGFTWWHDSLMDQAGHHYDNRDSSRLISALDQFIDELQRNGKRVVVIGPIAEPGWDVASTRSRQIAFGRPFSQPAYLPEHDFISRFGLALEHFSARHDMSFIRPDRIQCRQARCSYLLEGRSLYADGNHIAAAELYRFHDIFDAGLPSR